MKQPKLKIGRKVIAWNYGEPKEYKGKFISNDGKRSWVLLDGESIPEIFNHAQLDPEGQPINGDEVEVSNNAVSYMPQHYRYIGQRNDGLHTVEQNGIESIFRYVRHPQQSKRDKVIGVITDFMEDLLNPAEYLADQIDKIYTEEE